MVRANRPLETFFLRLDFKIEGNENLRDPQREAISEPMNSSAPARTRRSSKFLSAAARPAWPPFCRSVSPKGAFIVIAPNLTIKDGFYEAMDITNRQKCFWRKAGVLSQDQMISGPLACTLDSGNISVATKSHIVITNIQQLATNVDKWLTQFSDDFFDMIIVDEAHHSAAASWQKVIERFPKAKVIHMTATPFRSDRQEIDGELVFRYPFRSATFKGYIKRLKASYVAPTTIELSFTDERGRTYTLDEVLNEGRGVVQPRRRPCPTLQPAYRR